MCVCVCFWPPVTKWGTVMHEIPISSPPLDDIPSIPQDSVVLLIQCPSRGAFCMRRFQQVRSISVIGLRGSCWWAASQPRLLPRHIITRVGEAMQICVCPPSSTRDRMKNGVDFLKLVVGRSVTAAAHLARVRGRAGNQYLVRMGEMHKPYSRSRRARNTKYSILAYNQARRHWVYSGHYPGTFVAPKNTRNAETKHQSGAVSIPATSIIGFDDQRLLQPWSFTELNPQSQLLKASV